MGYLMTLDIVALNVIIIAVINIVVITGAYWRLKLEIRNRPTFKQIDEQPRPKLSCEKRMEEVIHRDAFPNADGEVLKEKIDNIENLVKHMVKKLDDVLKPKKEF